MPGIKQPLQDMLTRLTTLTVTNGDGSTVYLYCRVWNNQIRYEEDGTLYNFPKPAAFVEVVSPATFETLGQGYQSCDINFRVHLTHENYNNEGTFEQDLAIFDLRDRVKALLTAYEPTNCGPLNVINEQQDFEHTNVYHYIMDFVCNFTDTKGSKLDADHTDKFIPSVPPTTMILNVTTNDPYLKPQ